jgi:hypothetical protein
MKIFPLTIYVLLKPFIQILPSDSKKSLWESRTTATFSSMHNQNLVISRWLSSAPPAPVASPNAAHSAPSRCSSTRRTLSHRGGERRKNFPISIQWPENFPIPSTVKKIPLRAA